MTMLLVVAACGDDGAATTANSSETGDGDGDPGDGDGDPGDGDGDGDPGDGDGDGDSPCGLQWEATQMKVNGQTHAAFDVAVASDGKLAVVGKLENANDDGWVALLDPSGGLLWQHTVDSGNGPDAATGVTFDQAGDLVLVGRQAGASHQSLWIEKRSAAAGAVAWTVLEVSEFEGDNEPGDIALAPDGSLVVSGTIRAGDQDADLWVAKLASSDGSTAWSSSFSGSADENGFSIDRGGPVAVASDGSIYVGGTEGVNFETKEGVLLRFGPDGGAAQWQISPKASGSPHLHDVVAVAAGPEGEAYAVTYQSGNTWGFWLERISTSGDIEWALTHEDFVYEPTDTWLIAGLAIAQDGTLTVGGRLTNAEPEHAITWSEAWIANVSLDGVGQCIYAHTWENTHIIPAGTFGYGIAEGPNGAIVVGEIIDGPENYLWVGGFE
ncbi:MAG TPA: hypothetical protein VM869_13750 [Enhygromyxa sp.]|nr:hypothetical protein [Enhygromyxa sp.]